MIVNDKIHSQKQWLKSLKINKTVFIKTRYKYGRKPYR